MATTGESIQECSSSCEQVTINSANTNYSLITSCSYQETDEEKSSSGEVSCGNSQKMESTITQTGNSNSSFSHEQSLLITTACQNQGENVPPKCQVVLVNQSESNNQLAAVKKSQPVNVSECCKASVSGQVDTSLKCPDTSVGSPKEAKGGLAYEYIISDRVAESPNVLFRIPLDRQQSLEESFQKTNEAKGKKGLRHETVRSTSVEEISRVEHVRKRRVSQEQEFKTHAQDLLEKKISTAEANREKLRLEQTEKLLEHNVMHVKEIQEMNKALNMSVQEKAERKVQSKLEAATSKRELQRLNSIEKLMEHNVYHVKEVREIKEAITKSTQQL